MIIKNNSEQIERFFDHFFGKLENISSLRSDSEELFKKTLYVSLIDALSKAAYPKKSNKDRFVAVVERFGEWKEGAKLSLPHLAQLLYITPDPSFEKLRRHVFSEIKGWQIDSGGIIELAKDADRKTIYNLWPRPGDYKKLLSGLDIDSFNHYSLLWAYRNNLIHELRVPGYGMEMPKDNNPFYQCMSEFDDDLKIAPKSIELCYPTKFFERLAKTVCENMKNYFERNGLNPYNSYTFGTYWIEDLNM